MDKITYVSKEGNETITITRYTQGVSKVTELDYDHKLDEIAREYKSSKDRARRKVLKEEYRKLAFQLNLPYKKPIYNETL